MAEEDREGRGQGRFGGLVVEVEKGVVCAREELRPVQDFLSRRRCSRARFV